MSSPTNLAPRDVSTTLKYFKLVGERPPTPYRAVVNDAEFAFDIQGCQFVWFPSIEKDFVDDEVIKTKYYAEVGCLLRQRTGANAFISSTTSFGQKACISTKLTRPANVQRARVHLSEEADRFLQSRVRIIDVWRPCQNLVAHKPLCVSDWRTFDPTALVPIELFYPHRTGTTFGVTYNPGLKWPSLVMLLKMYDSREDVARLTPRSAFTDATSSRDAP
ncbi:hypothetical protein C8T65DRAFT_711126 [Cerioporus squamosus]|nr:hypothetical protein C8T65DRAFT_711126 [Cerioporus squamosus]